VTIIEKVRFALEKHRMVKEGNRVIVAVSGGPDSIALLDILFRLCDEFGITLHVAHLNHMFRGKDAEEDLIFVRNTAERYGLPVEVESFDVPAYIKKTGLSAQVAARIVRYNFLEQVAKKVDAQRVALGHHADDQAETVLINFLRGTGPAGLKGIPPVRDGFYIRPLIMLRRREIEEYCRERRLETRLDASNLKPVYLRNKVRMELIPYLETNYNAQLVPALTRLADICREENEFMDLVAEDAYREVSLPEGPGIDLKCFDKLPAALKRRVVRKVYAQIKRDGDELPFEHVHRVVEFAREGKVENILNLPGQVYIVKTYNRLIFKPQPVKYSSNTPYYCYRLEVPGETYIPELGLTIVSRIYNIENKPFCWDEISPGEALLDSDMLPKPLFARQRRPGDRFSPLGLSGTMKLKKFFINCKIPREKRDRIPLVASNGDIVWVGGMRPSEKWKVTSRTRRVLHLRILGSQ